MRGEGGDGSLKTCWPGQSAARLVIIESLDQVLIKGCDGLSDN
ncbi:hypothetical protein [Ornithinimicrobium sp. INDO-MA30-4]|nr:hypothetical protein [Ornithinimicrobium sp. INDO-MA30-4]